MLKLWTWWPLEHSFTVHKDYENAVEHVFLKVQQYEDKCNKQVERTNEHIRLANEQLKLPTQQKQMLPEIELEPYEIIDMFTVFDDEWNRILRHAKPKSHY